MASTIPLDTLKASTLHSPKMKSVKALAESASLSSLPSIYSFTHNPHDEPIISDDAEDSVPIIDVSLLVSGTPEERSQVVHQLNKACSDWGCFMVINHGVPESLTKAMIESFQEFFNLPEEEKQEFHGNHVMDPIRCGTGFNPSMDKVNLWRDYLKCFTYPEFHSPNKPAGFSEIALEFSKKNREVVTVLLKAISKSLGLEESYIDKATNIELGLQILAANYYPACPEPDRAIGIPSHTDHGLLTLLVDNGISGLQILHKEKWINVNLLPNALFVHIADHLEILSNGKCKSIEHRALVNDKATRMSIALPHGPSLDTVIRPAPELVDKESHPPAYVEMTYREFLELQQTGRLRSKFG
ncbi:2-oxoglutarate-dependent dioxygenase 19 [Quercus suber]|uniref:Protein dmr6-like oxygenase 2 n=1 Tax=Quercus suber TaxID=58331 RepID=A0AAW0JBB3_QUESU|nr:protein DMR6-LIKE OXYGENASE 2-like [Quercus suber]POF22882.1 protein dmr6-like oxygenase 2 [Quercus suber]